MMHRIREAMKVADAPVFTNSTVVADGTYIGGNPENVHANKCPHVTGRGTHKTAVFTLIDANTGESRSAVVPDVTGATLGADIRANVDPSGSALHSDAWKPHIGVGETSPSMSG